MPLLESNDNTALSILRRSAFLFFVFCCTCWIGSLTIPLNADRMSTNDGCIIVPFPAPITVRVQPVLPQRQKIHNTHNKVAFLSAGLKPWKFL